MVLNTLTPRTPQLTHPRLLLTSAYRCYLSTHDGRTILVEPPTPTSRRAAVGGNPLNRAVVRTRHSPTTRRAATAADPRMGFAGNPGEPGTIQAECKCRVRPRRGQNASMCEDFRYLLQSATFV
jgi:hypothetical protein